MTATFYPEGTSAKPGEMRPGDIVLTHGSAWYSKVIRYGQGLRYKGADRCCCTYNHAAVVINSDGMIFEALGDGIVRSHISKYRPVDYHLIDIEVSDDDRARMVKFAWENLTKPYDWLCIASLCLGLLLRTPFIYGTEGRYICSGFAACALDKTALELPVGQDPRHFMPADLAAYFGVRV